MQREAEAAVLQQLGPCPTDAADVVHEDEEDDEPARKRKAEEKEKAAAKAKKYRDEGQPAKARAVEEAAGLVVSAAANAAAKALKTWKDARTKIYNPLMGTAATKTTDQVRRVYVLALARVA
jgi:hypothetical protein